MTSFAASICSLLDLVLLSPPARFSSACRLDAVFHPIGPLSATPSCLSASSSDANVPGESGGEGDAQGDGVGNLDNGGAGASGRGNNAAFGSRDERELDSGAVLGQEYWDSLEAYDVWDVLDAALSGGSTLEDGC